MFKRAHLKSFSAAAFGVVMAAALASCSSAGSSSGGNVTITYMSPNDSLSLATARTFAAAFHKQNPTITVKVDPVPVGADGDNLVKTRLATHDMDDVFDYNTGSLFQALHPDQTLASLSSQSWVAEMSSQFRETVSTSKGVYGAPYGTALGGGILYNKKVYAKLGLSVPTTWDQFIANSQAIKTRDPGVAPVLQAYGDTWTSQLLVLADYGNIVAQDPQWTSQYNADKVNYSQQPAFEGFQHLAEVHQDGLLNKDFASMTNDQAVKALAMGTGAQYPMQTNQVGEIKQNYPAQLNDIGFFALPAMTAADTRATIWQPNALYIPITTTGAKLTAAEKFVEFVTSSKAGCAIQNKGGVPAGPYATSACKLTGSQPPMIQDLTKYVDEGKTESALEFLSPVKGPNLEKFCVQVGSGISSAAAGAQLYDQDVKQEAEQLGIAGW